MKGAAEREAFDDAPAPWYAVRVCWNRDRRVFGRLREAGFVACDPPTIRPAPDSRARLLFPGYLLVEKPASEQAWLELVATTGVVACNDHQPIEPELVAAIELLAAGNWIEEVLDEEPEGETGALELPSQPSVPALRVDWRGEPRVVLSLGALGHCLLSADLHDSVRFRRG